MEVPSHPESTAEYFIKLHFIFNVIYKKKKKLLTVHELVLVLVCTMLFQITAPSVCGQKKIHFWH